MVHGIVTANLRNCKNTPVAVKIWMNLFTAKDNAYKKKLNFILWNNYNVAVKLRNLTKKNMIKISSRLSSWIFKKKNIFIELSLSIFCKSSFNELLNGIKELSCKYVKKWTEFIGTIIIIFIPKN